MGHDYIDIGESYLRLNDFHIWTLRHLFSHCADTLQTDAQQRADLREFFAAWQWLGPGVVTGTDFNEFATSRDSVVLLGKLFDATLKYLNEFGEFIPLTYLESHVNSKHAYFTVDQPTSVFRDAIEALRGFLPLNS